jgi:membrane-associated phospholipid phosphatase
LTQFVHPLRQLDEHIDSEVGKQWSGRIKVDDYLQYAPVAAVFGLDLCGVKAKHNFRDRAFVTASSYLLMTLTVNAVKYTVEVQRPNGSPEYNSFPSGHTATVFTGAHLLFREYKDVSPWIGVAGYAAATATGVMRIANRKHWLSDVVAGAGTGIMCVEVSYLLLPVFHRVIGAPDHLVVVPVVGNNTYGAGFAYTF